MILGSFGLMNFIALYMFWLDKRNARKRRWRIPENTLLGIAFFGGALGALLGMYMFRHKTKHMKFKILVPLFLVLQIILIVSSFT